MRCPACHFDNADQSRFCGGCGQSLERLRCPSCDFPNPRSHAFCSECGAPLDAADGPRERAGASGAVAALVERRQVTVLFCDLVDSTRLAEQLELEDYRELTVEVYQPRCREIIQRFGGRVARYEGDGVLAYFGYPRALEDAAARAVHAALELSASIRGVRFERPGLPRFDLAVRIGIGTGTVIASELSELLSPEQEPLIGETLNRAKRLETLAAPNQVVIGWETRELAAAEFEYEFLGEHELKGFSRPTRVWRVLGVRSSPSRFHAHHEGRIGPLVGRQEELATLRARWRRALAGEGQVALIAGEAGIGKSRLVQAFRDDIASEPAVRLDYQCSSMHTQSAFHPVIARLEKLAGIGRADDETLRRRKTERLARHLPEQGADSTRLLCVLLSIATAEGSVSTPEQQRNRIMSLLLRQLEALSRRRPVLLIVEDMHWMDPTSSELLDMLVERIQGLRVLALVSSRAMSPPAWVSEPHVALIAMTRLTVPERHSLARDVAAGKALPEELIDQVSARSDGIPLAVEELTKSMLASGILGEEADRFVVLGALPPRMVPMTLKDSLMERLDRTEHAKSAAQLGAVIGERFGYRLLEAFRARTGAAGSDLVDDLATLCGAELLVRNGEPPDAEYVFKHALVRDAAYETLVQGERVRLHRELAEALRTAFPDATRLEPETLAYHLSCGGMASEAIESWSRAADQASKRSAHREAIAHLESALAELEKLPSADRDPLELGLRLALGVALIGARGWADEELAHNYGRARELAARVSNADLAFNANHGLINYQLIRGNVIRALALSEEQNRIAEQRGNADMLTTAKRALGGCCLHSGRFAAAREYLVDGYDHRGENGEQRPALVYGADPEIICLSLGAWADWFLGRVGESSVKIEAALARAADVEHPFSEAYAFGIAASLAQTRRQPEQARKLAEISVLIGTEHSLAFWLARGEIVIGWCTAMQGDADAGAAIVRAGIEGYERTGAGQLLPYAYTLLGEVLGLAGRFAEGIEAIRRAQSEAERHGLGMYAADTLRVRGELRLAAQGEAGFDDLEAACLVARRQHAASLELRAGLAYLRHAGDDGRRRGEARALLEQVLARFPNADDDAGPGQGCDALAS